MASSGYAHYYEDGDEQHVATLALTELRFLTTLFTPDELREIHLGWQCGSDSATPLAKATGHRLQLVDMCPADSDDWVVYERGASGWARNPDSGFLRECLLSWVRKCQRQGTPMFQHIDQTIAGTRSSYYRLLLPVEATDGAIKSVVILINRQPELVEP